MILYQINNTRDITIAEVESEWLDKILKQKDANRE